MFNGVLVSVSRSPLKDDASEGCDVNDFIIHRKGELNAWNDLESRKVSKYDFPDDHVSTIFYSFDSSIGKFCTTLLLLENISKI